MKKIIVTEKASQSKIFSELLERIEGAVFERGKLNELISERYIIIHLNSTCLNSQNVYDLTEEIGVGQTFGVQVDKSKMKREGSLIHRKTESGQDCTLLLSKETIENSSLVVVPSSIIINACDPSPEGDLLFQYFLSVNAFKNRTVRLNVYSYSNSEMEQAWSDLLASIKD